MSEIIPSLGGYVVVRNNHRLGYCAELAVESLLKICGEVILADVGSDDGTLETFQRWQDREPRLRVLQIPWTSPKGVGADWWIEVLNIARANLRTPFQITLDADEVLDDSAGCHEAIAEAVKKGESRRFIRLNYWKDPFHLIPHGHCCGHDVARLGPSNLLMPTDAPCDPKTFPIVAAATPDSRLVIHHVGFLRKPEKFFAKSRAVQEIWSGNYDDRLAAVETRMGAQWEIENCEWTSNLAPYHGPIPDAAQRWMAAQGHHTPHYLPVASFTPPAPAPRVRLPGSPTRFFHSGDLGDIVAAMPVIRQLGGGEVVLGNTHPSVTRERMTRERYNFIAPLLAAQDYITSVSFEDSPQGIDVDFTSFRQCGKTAHQNVAQWQATAMGVANLDLSPWINSGPCGETAGVTIFARTARYHNSTFPIRTLVKRYPRAIFIGTQAEWRDFVGKSGKRVPHRPTTTAQEVAELIAGCELFIGNQSCPCWIAMGLGHPLIQETSRIVPDSRVLRENARFVTHGRELMQR